MAFIPGTHKIVTASDDCKLQVWDLDDLLAQRLQKKGPGGDGEGPRE
jgi:hypothetical protein